MGRRAGRPQVFRTFHALHLPGYRTDPRPAAARRLACGIVAGGVVVVRADAALSQPSRRPRNRARAWPGIPGRNRSRPAAGILARRHRVSRRGQSHVRRLFAGAALFGRDILDFVPLGARHRRRTTGGTCGSLDHDSPGVQFARRRVRPAGAGAPAMGDLAAAFLAIDRPEPAQRLVCLVHRRRTAVADDFGRDRPVGIGDRICAGNLARAACGDVVRSAVRAPRHNRAGAALFHLADPCRRVCLGRIGRRCWIWAEGRCIGPSCLAACCLRYPAS